MKLIDLAMDLWNVADAVNTLKTVENLSERQQAVLAEGERLLASLQDEWNSKAKAKSANVLDEPGLENMKEAAALATWQQSLQSDCVEFQEILKNQRLLRATFKELITTEQDFISDYQRISENRAMFIEHLQAYLLEKEIINGDPADSQSCYMHVNHLPTYAAAINTIDKVKNTLALTAEDVLLLARAPAEVGIWIRNKFIYNDFMAFYQTKLQLWAIHFTQIQKMLRVLDKAYIAGEITLTEHQRNALQHAINKVSGAFQRAGRYPLFVKEIAKLSKCVAVAGDACQKVITFFEAQTEKFNKTLGYAKADDDLLSQLPKVIKALDEVAEQNKPKVWSIFSIFNRREKASDELYSRAIAATITRIKSNLETYYVKIHEASVSHQQRAGSAHYEAKFKTIETLKVVMHKEMLHQYQSLKKAIDGNAQIDAKDKERINASGLMDVIENVISEIAPLSDSTVSAGAELTSILKTR